MKPGVFLVVSLLSAAVGCARPAQRAAISADTAVATTELSAAEVETEPPKVGKPQHATPRDGEGTEKDGRRRDEPRGTGGFSGYK